MLGMQESGSRPAEPLELPEYAERVLELAERIPPGRVLTYGDVAGWLREEDAEAGRVGRGGPRQVGRVMALYGGAVPWWRVVRADGALLPGKEPRALERYRVEGTPLRAPAGDRRISGASAVPRVDLSAARWDPAGTSGREC